MEDPLSCTLQQAWCYYLTKALNSHAMPTGFDVKQFEVHMQFHINREYLDAWKYEIDFEC